MAAAGTWGAALPGDLLNARAPLSAEQCPGSMACRSLAGHLQILQAESSAPAVQMASPSRLTQRSMSGDMAPSTPTQGWDSRLAAREPAETQLASPPDAHLGAQTEGSMPPAQAMLQVLAPKGAEMGAQMASSMPPVQRGEQTLSTAGGQLRAQLVSTMSSCQMGAQTASSAHAPMGPQTGSSLARAQMVPPVATPAGAGMLTQPASSMPPAQRVPQVAVPAHVQVGSPVASSMPPLPVGRQVATPESAQTAAHLASSTLPAPVLWRRPTAVPALQSSAAPALEGSLPNLDSSIVEVDHRAAGRAGGDARVRLLSPLMRPPVGFTGQHAHQLPSLAGVKFFKQAHVVDPDDPTQTFKFDLADRTHCASFNLGPSPSTWPGTEDFLISWSNLHALYELPDGSTWAEHGWLLDIEDLATHAAQRSLSHDHLLQPCAMHMELFRKAGRYHSRLQNIELECWIFRDALPTADWLSQHKIESTDAYFWRKCFSPRTMQQCSP